MHSATFNTRCQANWMPGVFVLNGLSLTQYCVTDLSAVGPVATLDHFHLLCITCLQLLNSKSFDTLPIITKPLYIICSTLSTSYKVFMAPDKAEIDKQNASICKRTVFADNSFTKCSPAHVVISFSV